MELFVSKGLIYPLESLAKTCKWKKNSWKLLHSSAVKSPGGLVNFITVTWSFNREINLWYFNIILESMKDIKQTSWWDNVPFLNPFHGKKAWGPTWIWLYELCPRSGVFFVKQLFYYGLFFTDCFYYIIMSTGEKLFFPDRELKLSRLPASIITNWVL